MKGRKGSTARKRGDERRDIRTADEKIKGGQRGNMQIRLWFGPRCLLIIHTDTGLLLKARLRLIKPASP